MGLELLSDISNDWIRMPFAQTLGDEFTSLKEALTWMMEHSIEIAKNEGSDKEEVMKQLLECGSDKTNPAWYTRPYFADTSPGGNDAINCYPQFSEDDDLVHPITRSSDADGDGMGRVYSEMYEANQQILWLTFGVPEFNNPVSFFKDSFNASLSKLHRSGEGTLSEIGSVIGSFVGFTISLPFQPLIWLSKLFQWKKYQDISKYYDFKQSMLLYYEHVNGILTHIAANTGMLGGIDDNGSESSSTSITIPTDTSTSIYPQFMSKHGPDVFAIMNLRGKRADPNYQIKSLSEAINEDSGFKGWFKRFFSNFGPTTMGAGDYIGFRIEKSVDASESFTNQTGESSIASTLNGQTASAMDSSFKTGGLMGAAKDMIASALDAISLGGAAATIMGNAYVDIPDIWKGSAFNKSYSFNMVFRATYGDIVSITQSCYLPLALLLAGVLPRAVGKNAYTSPFMCRAYCKGRFAIPGGYITSLNIERGDSEFGWSKQGFPTVIKVSMQITDVSPAMYISMSNGNWSEIFGQNSSFQEYMLTLSGMGLQDRILYWKNWWRRLKTIASIRGSTSFLGLLLGEGNPYFWSSWSGNLGVPRTIGAFRRSLTPIN